MGIDLYCRGKWFSCSYSSWNNIRIECICAAIRYLESLLKTLNETLDQTIEEDEQKDFVYKREKNERNIEHLHVLIQMKPLLIKSVDSFLYQIQINNYIDTLISLELNGLYALINKSDCDGFYSPGNALDIVTLLNTIQPHMSSDIAELIQFIIPLFQKSIETNTRILIS